MDKNETEILYNLLFYLALQLFEKMEKYAFTTAVK